MPQLSAEWISAPLQKYFAKPLTTMRILSVYGRALNVVDERGQIVAIATHFTQMGPFHLCIPTIQLADVHKDELVQFNRCAIPAQQANTLTISVAEAIQWSPTVDWPSWNLDSAIARRLYKLLRCTTAPHKQALQEQQFGAALHAAIEQFHLAFSSQASDKLLLAITHLAGLGQGLTPAGDDFLLGVIAALYAVGKREIDPARGQLYATLPKIIAQTATPRTTRLSAQWLRCAAQGDFSLPWHQLANAMGQVDQNALPVAIGAISAIGATSGLDALTGFCAILETLVG